MSEPQALFDKDLIPKSVQDSLPEDVIARPLYSNDHEHGHLPLLSTLTKAPTLTPQAYTTQFNHLFSCPSTYYVLVLEHVPTKTLIGSASLVVEWKFIRGGGKVGHVEDVVVGPEWKGKSLGRVLVVGLSEMGKTLGCYKVILDCDPKNEGFYVKCGYHNAGTEMAFYHNK